MTDQQYSHPFPGNALVWADVYVGTGPYDGEQRENRTFMGIGRANLLSSQVVECEEVTTPEGNPVTYQRAKWNHNSVFGEKIHRPVIDIDMPVKVVPSTTEGHFHLYIDKEMPWSDYVKLLDVMAEVGIVEPGYVEAAKHRGATFCRLPWIRKEKFEEDNSTEELPFREF